MAPRYMSDHAKLLLTLRVLMMFVISTASTKQCTSKKTEPDSYVIRNIGIKLCHLKCAEHGECARIEYDIKTLTCRLLRDEPKVEKAEGHVVLARSHSHDPADSCTSVTCSFGQRCLKTRSGKEVCVQVSTTDGSEDLSPSETDPLAPVTTQKCDPRATPSPAGHRLYSASRDGDLVRVKRILSAGHVNINRRVYKSRTPVMVAAQKGHKDVLESLLGRGADVSLVDSNGYNVLHWACMDGGDLETVKLILSLNVLDINARGHNSLTPVMSAAYMGHRDMVEFLVGRGADVSLVNRDSNNVLHFACTDVGNLETVKLILSLKVLDINARGEHSRTPVMMAACDGHSDVVEFLVSREADLSLVDEDGNNVLHLACKSGDMKTVKLILSLNVMDINATNNDGRTAADRARTRGHQGMVDLLVSHGAH